MDCSHFNLPDLDISFADVENRQLVERIWARDYTVWKPDPDEIANRLGWLDIANQMAPLCEDIRRFAEDVRRSGYRYVVLLGMGGSSLGPEVLRQTFGSAGGYLRLFVLDSTVPEWIESVTQQIDLRQTLFLVSSKSGTTIEPNSLHSYFGGLLQEGGKPAGPHFAAVTDAGTALDVMASRQNFRRVFRNPEDIGGRYSVLSYFGLVPAALIGIQISELLQRAETMRARCLAEVPLPENPGAWLGTVMGRTAIMGRDKLTLLTSPSLSGFGLWVEQLLAESTGKEGKGVIPVAGEPVVSPEHYGPDRLFVYLRLNDDDNFKNDAAAEKLVQAGHPLVRLDLEDRYDLGGEFFRWEFATAVAGAVLGINPFDQPNVQSAKDMTDRMLSQMEAGEAASQQAAGDDQAVKNLLDDVASGNYLAILPYLNPSPELDQSLYRLRQKMLLKWGIPVTVGYGPRYLHSAGQLHKGGPNSGLFLFIGQDHTADLAIPGQAYSFGQLAHAQSLGDYQALQAAGRRVAMIRLAGDVATEVMRLAQAL